MKTFNDLKIGDKIYIVDFDPVEEIKSACTAEVISITKVSDYMNITFRHHTKKIGDFTVFEGATSSDWYGNTMFFASKETAIARIKCWVEEAKENLYATNKLLVKVKELK